MFVSLFDLLTRVFGVIVQAGVNLLRWPALGCYFGLLAICRKSANGRVKRLQLLVALVLVIGLSLLPALVVCWLLGAGIASLALLSLAAFGLLALAGELSREVNRRIAAGAVESRK